MRAGFDPLRGADFFTRRLLERAKAAPGSALSEAQLANQREEVTRALNACTQETNAWRSGRVAQTQQNADQVNGICSDAENKRVAFNRTNAEYYTAQAQEILQRAVGSHPADQSRVAALAATVDFMAGRRDVESLASYETSHRVMVALQRADSVLLKPPSQLVASDPKSVSVPDRGDLAAQLETLKRAFDAGLISSEEYQSKRKELLARL